MAGKKKDNVKEGKSKGKEKDAKKRKREKRKVDEFQLRRELRDQKRRMADFDFDEENEIPVEVEVPKKPSKMMIGGIDGGATQSALTLLDEKGNILTEFKGPHTNHWTLGIEEVAARINAMIQRAKELAEMPESVPLSCVGLSLSGCEEEDTNRILKETLLEMYPNAAEEYVITSDTIGSLRTGLDGGGVVLISGTGSNGLLIDIDGKTHGCGGWGHMLGDEGSAYWITHRAWKYCIDDIDGLAESPQPISYVWPAIRSYFGITENNAILPIFYTNFNKSIIAKFTIEIATGCEKGDPLCLQVFAEAGQQLARHLVPLAKKAHNDIKLKYGGLKVICVGSVWKSWQYLKPGFVEEIKKSAIEELSLLQLQVSPSLGACYLAAEKVECHFKKPYDNNAKVFYHYVRKT